MSKIKSKYFINLTNGIEALNTYNFEEVAFIRIQSCLCESKQWEKILWDVDYHFLMCLALGYQCYLYDYSHHKRMPRAFYQGIPWIQYTLNRIWFNREIDILVKGYNCKKYFTKCYTTLSKPVKQRLKYFRKFLNTNKLNINLIYGQTDHDGQYDYFRNLLFEEFRQGK